MGLNRFYRAGIHIGAVPSKEWEVSRYEALAREFWKGIEDPFAVISIARDGEKFGIKSFATRDDAAAYYSELADKPGWIVYLAYFDRSFLRGEDALTESAFFQPTEIIKTERVPFAVKAGLGLAGILGLLALAAKH